MVNKIERRRKGTRSERRGRETEGEEREERGRRKTRRRTTKRKSPKYLLEGYKKQLIDCLQTIESECHDKKKGTTK